MTLSARLTRHACQATSAYVPTLPVSILRKYPLGTNFNRLDGREEDRGIEPLWLLPAVQRLASVPSTHTGSVLQSRAYHAADFIGCPSNFCVMDGHKLWPQSRFGTVGAVLKYPAQPYCGHERKICS